jgi:hypothetical protein
MKAISSSVKAISDPVLLRLLRALLLRITLLLLLREVIGSFGSG